LEHSQHSLLQRPFSKKQVITTIGKILDEIVRIKHTQKHGGGKTHSSYDGIEIPIESLIVVKTM